MWEYRASKAPDQLLHYASPYYDPVKAHEYYMRHRKLKGRRIGAGASSLKEQLNREYQEEAKKLTTKANDDAAESRAEIQRDIATLRSKYKGMSKEERARHKSETQRDIQSLRLQIKRERADIFRRLGIDLGSLGSAYNQIYNEELARAGQRSGRTTKKTASTPITQQTDQPKKKQQNTTHPGGRRKIAEVK